MNFKSRSYQKELLDGNNIPFEDIRKNMQEIDFINRHLGGHRVTLKGLKKLIPQNISELHVCEIGCGAGGNLQAIAGWAFAHGIEIRLTGIDINRECIRTAIEMHPDDRFHFICSDYRDVHFESPPDIIFNTLFCHHFTNDELIGMFKWMDQNSTLGFFINDLHRHFLAYYSIKLLTGIFSGSYLVRNDAPLSVLRGFRNRELEILMEDSGMKNYEINWHWAFRWLLIKNNS